MTIRLRRILFLGLCISLASLWASGFRNYNRDWGSCDFATIYYATRCALEHKDPYDPATVYREVQASGRTISTSDPVQRELIQNVFSILVYPPTTLFVAAPFTLLSWPGAVTAWATLMAALLTVAAFLMWELAADASWLAGCMACFMLLNCGIVLGTGNPTGIAVPLCVIAAWCLLKERYAPVGVLLMALSLVMKPHDSGFVWLYFLLAGATNRKRALQSLLVAGVFGICALIWITPISPQWITEGRRDIAQLMSSGGPADPGPFGPPAMDAAPVISLQGALAVFSDNPHFYNSISYLIGGILILVWIVAVRRKSSTGQAALLGLAATSILAMLPVYHRQYDAKLLLLALPACAMLWASKGVKRWAALALTSAAVLSTSDFPYKIWSPITGGVSASASTITGKLLLLLLEPGPLILLSAGCFYLWAYMCYEPPVAGAGRSEEQTVTQLTAG